MVKLHDEEIVKVVIVNKDGVRTIMPDVKMAEYYATKLWKGKVDSIEIKTIIKVE